jgi:peptidyl-tRNA hydrolase, PTH1 family
MKLVVGLGNPEDKYIGTRHNLGFEVLEHLREKLNLGEWSLEKKLKSEVIKTKIDGEDIILARPQTYMNNSGQAVSLLANYYKVSPEEVIVIHDDLDLKLGQIKIRLGGAAGGHHGVESVMAGLATDKFLRVRLGIGNIRTTSAEHKEIHVSVENYVLEPFLRQEKPKVKHMLKQAINALELLLNEGLEKAQNQFN